jgi:hypothetical protein
LAHSTHTLRRWPPWLLGLLTLAAIALAAAASPIPQDAAYHRFADGRSIAGLANFWNVVSNAGFPLVGAFGLSRLGSLPARDLRTVYAVFCVAVLAVGFGSALYHYAPSTATLTWDRLPMSVAFMALFAAIGSDRVSPAFGKALLWPLLLIGAGSVAYWHWSELQGRGDLRPYGLVQFLPMVLLPVMLLTCPGSRRSVPWLWLAFAGYGLAKLTEHFDGEILRACGLSGHSLKHVLAAGAVWCAVQALLRLEAPRGTIRMLAARRA